MISSATPPPPVREAPDYRSLPPAGKAGDRLRDELEAARHLSLGELCAGIVEDDRAGPTIAVRVAAS